MNKSHTLMHIISKTIMLNHASITQIGVCAMRKKICIMLLACSLLGLPATTAAAPVAIGFSFAMPGDGIVCSELIYNGQVVWRIQLLSDGAKPVTGGNSGQTTIVVPDIVYGLFTVKINKQ